jgi:hypothetical protein
MARSTVPVTVTLPPAGHGFVRSKAPRAGVEVEAGRARQVGRGEESVTELRELRRLAGRGIVAGAGRASLARGGRSQHQEQGGQLSVEHGDLDGGGDRTPTPGGNGCYSGGASGVGRRPARYRIAAASTTSVLRTV